MYSTLLPKNLYNLPPRLLRPVRRSPSPPLHSVARAQQQQQIMPSFCRPACSFFLPILLSSLATAHRCWASFPPPTTSQLRRHSIGLQQQTNPAATTEQQHIAVVDATPFRHRSITTDHRLFSSSKHQPPPLTFIPSDGFWCSRPSCSTNPAVVPAATTQPSSSLASLTPPPLSFSGHFPAIRAAVAGVTPANRLLCPLSSSAEKRSPTDHQTPLENPIFFSFPLIS